MKPLVQREVSVSGGSSASGLDAWRRELQELLLQDVGEPEAEEPGAAGARGKLEVLAFRLASEVYAVDIRDVVEILMARVVAPVPRTRDFVKGVASLRGSVLPVVDLARRLGLSETKASKSSRIIVLRDGEDQLGFWVDQVQGVLRFSEDEVERSGFAAAVDPRFVLAIGYDRSGELVAVLSVDRLCDFRLEEA